MKVVLDRSAEMLAWASERIAEMHGQPFPDGASAIGVESEDGKTMGVVCFHSWEPWNRTIEVSAIAEDPRWMRARAAFDMMFRYAFYVCECDKIWSRTPRRNERALRFVWGLGFEPEAILSRQFGDDDAVISRMFRWDWEKRRQPLQEAA